MANVLVEETSLENIADAIRSKNGLTTKYKPSEMADAISAISGGGITPTGTKQITTNGTHDVTNYASAQVAVPNSYSASDEGKVVSNGALVSQTSRTVTSNGTVDTTLNNEVVVNVPTGITPSGSQTFTENGTYDVTNIAEAVVNVESSGLSIDDWVSTGPVGDITISASTIKQSALAHCKALEKVTILRNATIGSNAFQETSITEFIAHELTSLPTSALWKCSSLTMVCAPKCNFFDYQAFSTCANLSVIDVKGTSGITRGVAFANCTKLTTLILRSTTLASLGNVGNFNGTPFHTTGQQGTLYVPSALVEDYKTATNWSTLYTDGTMVVLPIEGSIYETQYADGTPVE